MRARAFTLIAAALLIHGCGTPQSRQDREQDRLSSLQNKCSAYGFRPGTDAFADCIRREHLCAQERNRAQSDLNAAFARENAKPGSRFVDSMNRAQAQVRPAACN